MTNSSKTLAKREGKGDLQQKQIGAVGSGVITRSVAVTMFARPVGTRLKNTCFVDTHVLLLIRCICNAGSLAMHEGFVDKAAGIP